jgi:hypothetical protein
MDFNRGAREVTVPNPLVDECQQPNKQPSAGGAVRMTKSRVNPCESKPLETAAAALVLPNNVARVSTSAVVDTQDLTRRQSVLDWSVIALPRGYSRTGVDNVLETPQAADRVGDTLALGRVEM